MTDKTLHEALEREQFERWRNDYFGPLHTNVESHAMWTAWQARACLAAPVYCGHGCACVTQCGDAYDYAGKPKPPAKEYHHNTTSGVAVMTDAECWEQGKPDSIDRAMAAERRDVSPQAGEETPAEEALRSLACWLGVGGYNAPTVDAKVFEEKIRWGVEHYTSVRATARPPAVEAEPVASNLFLAATDLLYALDNTLPDGQQRDKLRSALASHAAPAPQSPAGVVKQFEQWLHSPQCPIPAGTAVTALVVRAAREAWQTAASLQQPQEGWVSVPRKVTNAMIDTANGVESGIAGSPPHWQWVWDAMIAAATSKGGE